MSLPRESSVNAIDCARRESIRSSLRNSSAMACRTFGHIFLLNLLPAIGAPVALLTKMFLSKDRKDSPRLTVFHTCAM